MPNQTTGQVKCTTTPFEDVKTRRGLAAGATIYVTGQMIATNAAGYACHCDDTAGVRFDGIMADTNPIEVTAADANGDKVVNVEHPWRFTMKIAAAVPGDIGKKVYAKFNNEVQLAIGTNSILVGWIAEIGKGGTEVSVAPVWAPLAAS
jgi:hypothetical protein